MKHFTLEECIRSAMAVKYGIDNTPDAESKDHIIESIENLLDPLQEAWSQLCASKGIERDNLMITSGYRCRELNNRMKESSTSAHTIGYAFDLLPANRLIMDFRKFCKDYLSDKPFDQLISEQEDNSGIPSWIHIGYKDHQRRQHRRMLSMREERYYLWEE